MTPKKRLTKLREMLLPTTASILPRSSNIFDWPLASLRRHCDRMPHPPTRVIATACEAGGKQSRKNNALLCWGTREWMAARLIATRHDAGINRERTSNKPLALHPHPRHGNHTSHSPPSSLRHASQSPSHRLRHCDRTRSVAGSNPKKIIALYHLAQEHGWPRGLSPLAMTQG
jgi:hypothetical protein